MVFADQGCTENVIAKFEEYNKPRGQEFLEEIDVWFSSRKELNNLKEHPKETGIYMVHYVEDADDQNDLRSLLMQRGVEAES